VSEGRHSPVSEIAEGVHVDFSKPDTAIKTILAAIERKPVSGVIGCDDDTVELAARVAEQLGLTTNPPAASRISRRKDLARQCLADAGVPVPDFTLIDTDRDIASQLDAISFPCVVKPVSLSGSRGVIRADDPDQLLAACRRVQDILAGELHLADQERRYLLIETFIPGPEVAVEGLLREGSLEVLAIFDKPDPLDGPYFEETLYTTPSRLPRIAQQKIQQRVADICHAYGLVNGPVHAELRWYDGDAWVMELASRTIGGQCARLLRFSTGLALEEVVLLNALGGHIEPAQASGAAGVMMIPIRRPGILRRVEGLLAAGKVPGVRDIEISIREGYELRPLPEGASYLGFIFATAKTPAAAEQALRQAYAKLEIIAAPVLACAAVTGSAGESPG
jgi:biotin carboxylase